MKLFRMSWEYYTLKNGVLVDDAGEAVLDPGRQFQSIEEAEAWLEENDIRGSVRSEPVIWDGKYAGGGFFERSE